MNTWVLVLTNDLGGLSELYNRCFGFQYPGDLLNPVVLPLECRCRVSAEMPLLQIKLRIHGAGYCIECLSGGKVIQQGL